MPEPRDYQLVDAGDGRRLEQFGALTVDRPAAGAIEPRRAPEAWHDADLRFDLGPGWTGHAAPAAPWQISIADLTMELRPTSSGGLGLYPEHAISLPWLEAQVTALSPRPAVLNLFAHTGLATLAAARAGASVVHVDGAAAAVSWARRNAALNALDDRPIRWLVDDAAAFVLRERRRGRRYGGFVLDPPSFGRAGRRTWRLEDDLPDMLAGCAAIASPGAFVLLTAHSEGLGSRVMTAELEAAFDVGRGAVEAVPLEIDASSGASLALGWAVRLAARTDGAGRRSR